MGVTKTDFMRGLQCRKMLWLDSHKPQEKIVPEEVQRRLDAGNEFGDRAMGIFGEYAEMTAYRADGRLDYAAMLKKTEECLLAGTPVLCEAAFSWYGNYCAADILRKTESGYELYEVKNAADPRREFLIDLGFQRFLIRKCGVKIEGCFLILRGEPGVEEGDGGAENGEEDKNDGGRYAFKVVDKTKEAKIFERAAEKNIWDFGKLKRQPDEPLVSVGEQCEKPYRCWYYDYCHK